VDLATRRRRNVIAPYFTDGAHSVQTLTRSSSKAERPRTRYPNARILIADDEEVNLRLLKRLLAWAGFLDVNTVHQSNRVLAVFDEIDPDLVMLDLNMPRPDGFTIMKELEGRIPAESYLPVIVISGEFTAEAKQRSFTSVAKDFIGKPFDAMEILLRTENLLQTRYLHLALRDQKARLEEMVLERTRALEVAQAETLRRLAQAAEFRDDDTGQHTRRVGTLAALIAGQMGLPSDVVETIRQAAPLHDVGKIGVPDNILFKPGKLTPEEFAAMKRHTIIGADLLAGGLSGVEGMAEEIARCHHEKWDGSGYPNGLAGEQIPLSARVVAVADFYDALSFERPYRPPWPQREIFVEIESERGRHFDPAVVDAFFELVRKGDTTALGEWGW
jgi:putative two-component system response regulator